jgi:hypothetical protein
MNTIKLTPDNAYQYVGYEIIFKSRNNHIIKRIINISDSGKSVYIDHPDLHNTLQIVSRNIYVILE